MSQVQIFFEGDSSLKLPLIHFITAAIPTLQGKLRIRLGKNKEETIKDFLRVLEEEPHANVILLVDSDSPDDGRLFENLRATRTWRKHAARKELAEQVHWMVQIMESWFIADIDALRSYYGKRFKIKALPKTNNVEQITKEDVFKTLKQASSGQYDKTAHAPRILERLSPDAVRPRSCNCGRFFAALPKLAE